MYSVLRFWFEEIETKQWWIKDPEFDQLIKDRFLAVYQQAIQCELYSWRALPEGRLAEIIVLDQFSRNMFRDDKAAFAYDSLALALTQSAIDVGADQAFMDEPKKLAFLYMPLMHSESPVVHQLAVEMFAKPGLESNLEFEHKHKSIIDQFGRYPHRNQVLGRQSSEAELAFLQQPGSSF
ncbi:DUF924 family protein [Marinicella litoralis]|uniref:Uncharacterized protein (DUF924 family) n=1 Tax=Marinicella litoralis TaxID=644220 RepID=A0A4R6XGS9_9GAMM|nr:DUF924 family protein [Marinicella litoralis]TDR17489.1 uncharacterized protein (DUF924 family) [Marinicella litoralis]